MDHSRDCLEEKKASNQKNDVQKTEKVLTSPALAFSLEDLNLVCPVALL